MENVKVTRTWGVAAAIVAAIVCVAAAALAITTLAKAQTAPPCCPAVVNHWLPQPILESKFTERVLRDNKDILNGLQAFVKDPDMTADGMMKYVAATYLRTPRFWTKMGWVEGWDNVLPALKAVISRDSHPIITSITVLIEYQPFTGAAEPAKDIDAVAKIRMTFSASPGGQTFEGTLKHSRVCEII